MQTDEQTLRNIRAYIDRNPEFEAYHDYFDTLRLIGKEDKATSFEYNLWLRQESARKVCEAADTALIEKFYELNKKT